jgi:hypothetical protein
MSSFARKTSGVRPVAEYLRGKFNRARTSPRLQTSGRAARQWGINVSAAGVLLAMQVISPGAARGDAGHIQLRLASAFRPAVSGTLQPDIAHPALFGTTEIKAKNISYFTKWTSAVNLTH